MMRQDDEDFCLSPSERMKRNFIRRRWSDSPTLLQKDLRTGGGMQLTPDHELTQSLHDLTEPILPPVSKVSSASQNNVSTSTLQSGMGARTKSQDSGFNKSASCLSLHSSNRKYSHVESKVKKYVQDIKQAEALRKKSLSQNSVNLFTSPNKLDELTPFSEPDENADKIIDKLQSDLRDKENYIRALQGSYEDLLLKHAEAENKIDRLRLRSLQRFPDFRNSQQWFEDDLDFHPHYSPDRNFVHDFKTSFLPETPKLPIKATAEDSCADGSFTPSVSESIILSPPIYSDRSKSGSSKSRSKEVIISAPLGPVQKLYSTSVRLDRVLQPLSQVFVKCDSSKLSPELHSSTQIVKEDQLEQKVTSDGCSEDFGGAKSNIYFTAAEIGTNNLYHMTTDTGIEDCIQSATDRETAENERKAPGRLPIGSELKRIPNIPNEDAFSKVQRWRDSLPSTITKVELSKQKKQKSRRPVLPRKTVGVQVDVSWDPNSSALAAETSDNDYAESLEMTDCDNYSSEMSPKNRKKKSWSTNVTRANQAVFRSRSVETLNRHRCCGKCKTCGSAIVAEAPLEFPSSSTSYLSPKEKPKEPGGRKLIEKARRDWSCQRKSVRCSRVAGTQVTRAVLLDMLLNVQAGHSCCCCCQHSWRGRQPASPVPKEDTNQEKGSENALQQCLAEIQEIAWDLNAKLAQSHAGLVNLSSRKRN